MKKILILLFLTFISCGIEYDGETKLVTKGKLISKDGTPISNLKVSVYHQLFGSPGAIIFPGIPGEYVEIAVDYTNENGEFLLINPMPKNEDQSIVMINDLEINNLQKKSFTKIKNKDFENYKLDLKNIKLFSNSEIVNLAIELEFQTPNIRLVEVNLIGDDATKEVGINPFLFSDIDFYYYLPIYQVKKNQIITVEYKIKNVISNIITTSTVEIPIFEDAVNYTLIL